MDCALIILFFQSNALKQYVSITGNRHRFHLRDDIQMMKLGDIVHFHWQPLDVLEFTGKTEMCPTCSSTKRDALSWQT